MTPVRWKTTVITVIIVAFIPFLECITAQHMQNTISSMVADGWRPIMGNRHKTEFQNQITYYKNPIQNNEPIKAETIVNTTTAKPTTQATTPATTSKETPTTSAPNIISHGQRGINNVHGKLPVHTKYSPITPYYVLPNHGSHGPHIPLGAVQHGRPGQYGIIKKVPIYSKQHPHMTLNGKKMVKPIRTQSTSHSNREEVFVPAPNNGAYSYFAHGQNLKVRETPGNKIYPQPHLHHLEYPGLDTDHVFQHFHNPIQQYIFPKPDINEIHYQVSSHNEEMNRNLVPPPLHQNFKDKNQIKVLKQKDPSTSTSPNKNIVKQAVASESLLLPGQSYQQQKFNLPNPNEQVNNVEITKENFKIFHNDAPINFYKHPNEFAIRRPTEHSKLQTYEVTEDNWPERNPIFNNVPLIAEQDRFSKPSRLRTPAVELNVPQFLPTPYSPINLSVEPTSSSQNDVSTIFSQLSQSIRQRPSVSSASPQFFDIKEVSTHFPIFGGPDVYSNNVVRTTLSPFIYELPNNELTTINSEEVSPNIVTIKNAQLNPINNNKRRRRPLNRVKTTTEEAVTEMFEWPKAEENETDGTLEIEKPTKIRRPSRVRTTTTSLPEIEEIKPINKVQNRTRLRPNTDYRKNTLRNRYKASKDDSEISISPKMTEVEYGFTEYSTEVNPTIAYFSTTQVNEIATQPPRTTTNRPRDVQETSSIREINQTSKQSYENDNQEINDDISNIDFNEAILIDHPISKTEIPSTDNELEYPTIKDVEEDILLKEKPLESTSENVAVSTTTEEPTTKFPRARRPVKYDTSSRPRFSVKDYKQRLNQYTSSTTSTTQRPTRNPDSVKVRMPTRLRRPVSTLSPSLATEEATEIVRHRFTPKEPRHSESVSTTESSTTKRNNIRIRPFGRYKPSTEPSTTSATKVSIKPNLFANRKRPIQVSLKTKINTRNKTSSDEESLTAKASNIEFKETAPSGDGNTNPTTTYKTKSVQDEDTEEYESSTSDILKNDAFLYSQRVSDLTSSAKNDYNVPGVFKSVPPSSRRIPNYFTISTDDPILPIEAFFPNIKDKDKEV